MKYIIKKDINVKPEGKYFMDPEHTTLPEKFDTLKDAINYIYKTDIDKEQRDAAMTTGGNAHFDITETGHKGDGSTPVITMHVSYIDPPREPFWDVVYSIQCVDEEGNTKAINWDELDWGDPNDFDKPDEINKNLDLSELDFEHYIWLCFYDDATIAIGDEKGFWDWWEEEQNYYTPEELLDRLLSEDEALKIPRDLAGYKLLE